MTNLSTLAETAKAWPFELARKLKARVEQMEKAGQRKAGAPVLVVHMWHNSSCLILECW